MGMTNTHTQPATFFITSRGMVTADEMRAQAQAKANAAAATNRRTQLRRMWDDQVLSYARGPVGGPWTRQARNEAARRGLAV